VTSIAAVAALAATGLALAPTGANATTTAGNPGVAAARASSLASAQEKATETAKGLKLGAKEGLTVRDVLRDANGRTHVRYNRTFAGLRVIGGDLVVHKTPKGAIERVDKAGSGAVEVASTKAKIPPRTATATGRSEATFAPSKSRAELVVYAAGAKPRLAYDVVVEGVGADQTPSRLHTIVDARTGKQLAKWDDIKEGTGHSIYSGTVAIGTSGSAPSFKMSDPTRGGNNTTDLNGATSGSGTLFTDADDIWGNGTTSDRASAGVDAHYGAQLTWDYYKNTHGRNGIFNNGVGARSRVHYGNAYVNAFWDGTQMTYGDGAGNARPLTSIDVAGHEMSHGVTEATAGLEYTGDAGGLNESTSDIFGTAVEFYANNANDVGDYLIGEEINIRGNGTPLRYMDKPFRDGSSPDCWSTNTKNLDPHYSSGVGNHFFYLASEGSGAKVINGVSYNSPTCDGSTVTGIGRDKVGKIWYRALSTYMVSTTNYSQARDATLKSAKDLYGATGPECPAIEKAWIALSVPAGSETCGTTPPPPGNLLGNPGFESGATVWTSTAGTITSSTSRPAHSGSWKAWLGGNGRTATENVAQTVTIPAGATAPALSYWFRSDTSESGSTVYDTLRVQIISGGVTTTLTTYSNVGTNATFTKKSHSLAAYKGKTISVKFLMNEDPSLQTSFVVDDTAVTTS
jgi:Zn-dependent metalloprotease